MTKTTIAVPLRILIPVLAMISAFAPIATDMYLPGLSHMTGVFQTTTGHVQATISVFFLGLAVGQAIYGPLVDRYGRKPLLLTGIGIYVAASLGCMLVERIEWFIALRFMQAIGGSAGMMIGRAIITDLFDRTETARVLSLMMMVVILAPILAPIAGGWMVPNLGWRSIFAFTLIFGLVCWALVAWLIPETLAPENRQPLSFGNTLSTYLHLLRNPHFIIPAISGSLIHGSMFANITGSEFVFTQLFGLSEQQYGWMFAFNALGIILATNGNRFSLKRWPIERIFGTALAANLLFGLALVALAGTARLWVFIIPMWLLIATLGFVGANSTAIAMSATGRHAGSGSGLVGVMQFGLAFLVSSAVAATQNGTAYPMAITMLLCGLAGCTLWFGIRPLVLKKR